MPCTGIRLVEPCHHGICNRGDDCKSSISTKKERDAGRASNQARHGQGLNQGSSSEDRENRKLKNVKDIYDRESTKLVRD